MSRSTLVKYKGRTIMDLGRTVDPGFLPARNRDALVEWEQEFKTYLISTITAMMAHHPTKEEVDVGVREVGQLVDEIAEEFMKGGKAQLLIEMLEHDNIEIKFT